MASSNWLKQNWGKIILTIIALSLSFRDSTVSWVILLIYGLLINLILTKSIHKKFLQILKITIWTIFIVVTGLTVYVNYYLPHGPSYPTGDIVCQNDDRGPCGEQYKEDLRELHIPDWAKFLRVAEGQLLWVGLFFAGIVLSSKNKELNP